MFPISKKLHLQCCILISAALLMPSTKAAMYVGDSCSMKSQTGVCKLASNCPELERAVRAGSFSARDIVSCGFATHEEIICCPTGNGVVTENRSDDKFVFENSALSTTASTIITSTTSTEPSEQDFWLHLLSTTPTPPTEEVSTTTAKPDFWLYLLNTTTTTTTTTPKPLIINGKEIDPNERFIDLTAMLSNNNRQEGNDETNEREPRDNQSPQIPATINDRTFGWQNPPMGIPNPTVEWNMHRPRQFSPMGMPSFQPNPGMPFRNSPQNRQQPRFNWPVGPLNMGGNAFFQQPFQAPMQQGFRDPNRNLRNMQPLRFPNDGIVSPIFPQPGPVQTFGTDWNNNNNPRQLWQENNDRTQENPLSENIWPNRGPQNAAMNVATQWRASPKASSNPILNEPVRSLSKTSKPVFASNNMENPIETINENLKKSGIEVIKATLDEEEHDGNKLSSENFIKTTTQPAMTADPFDSFQFRPQPEENFDENTGRNMDFSETNDNSDRRPIWGHAKSTKMPTTSTTSRTPVAPVTTRNSDRPAVVACREIDEGLDPALTPHILGGTPAEIGEFPHMAAIGYSTIGNDQGPYDFRCGGTLIAKRFVLTAAHCVNSRDSQPAVVLLGLININDAQERKSAEEVPIRQVHIHPEYSNSRTYNDIAILELERDVPYSANIYPTCLYTDLNDPPKNTVLYVTGWGQINTATRQRSNILLKAKLEIVPVSRCNESYVEMGLNRRINQGVQEKQLCANDPGFVRDACQGDSGGPLNLVVDESMKKYRIIGVISAGFSCGSATPGLYSRVAAYLDFIEGIVWPSRS